MFAMSPTQSAKSQPDGSFANKKPAATSATPATPGAVKPPEENKESFEYQKKQAFINGPHIRMEYSNSEQYGMPESLFTGLKDMFEAVMTHQSRTGIVTPAKVLEILKRENEIFRSPMHQDAHEFLNFLLNQVVDQVESYSKSTNAIEQHTMKSHGSSSWVRELFEGTLTSETRCLTCENTSQRDEPFLDLSVDLEEHSSVTSCLRSFSQEEMLCERNKFHCDKCSGLQEAEKRMKIKKLPRILALHLKRFKYVEELGRLQKLFHRVVFPYYLRLFNTTDDAEDQDRIYELYAIVVHLGSTPFHGHYVSIIKTKDKGWLLFDDELVTPVDKTYVQNFFGGDSRNPACAYVLFYQETTEEAVRKEQETEETVVNMPADATTNNRSSMMFDGNAFSGPTLTSPIPPTPFIDEEPIPARLEHAVTAPVRSFTPGHRTQTDYFSTSSSPQDGSLQTSSTNSSTPASGTSLPTRPGATPQRPAVKTTLSRFRPTSMSVRSKSGFWGGSKDKNDDIPEGVVAATPTDSQRERDREREREAESPIDKPKSSRFSLGRKRTSMIG